MIAGPSSRLHRRLSCANHEAVCSHSPGRPRSWRFSRAWPCTPGDHAARVQLRHRRQRHLLGHPGRRLAARRHREHSRDAGRARRIRPAPTAPRSTASAASRCCVQTHTGAALQRRADARLRPELRRCRIASRTTQSIDLGGVTISRSVYINRGANWGRWLDTFTNTTKSPLTIKVAFGGQSGSSAHPARTRARWSTPPAATRRSTAADAWVEVATPLSGTTLGRRPAGDGDRHADARSAAR